MTRAGLQRYGGALADAVGPAIPFMDRPSLDGLLSLVFFGGFGVWSFTAPLNGAVVANGIVKVDGNRKSVQHLDGGIVKELRVREGDQSSAIFSSSLRFQARAEFDVLSEQFIVLRATEERLRTESTAGPVSSCRLTSAIAGDQAPRAAFGAIRSGNLKASA